MCDDFRKHDEQDRAHWHEPQQDKQSDVFTIGTDISKYNHKRNRNEDNLVFRSVSFETKERVIKLKRGAYLELNQNQRKYPRMFRKRIINVPGFPSHETSQ